MNYRHAYHAGNFADVAKHAILARLLLRLGEKDKAYRVIDTHAGTGQTDLRGIEAGKTGEWQDGIGRLMDAELPPQLRQELAPYLDAIRARNPDPDKPVYPGSPWIVRALLRPQDRLTAVELHPEDAAALAAQFEGDFQVRTIHLDGWLALGSFVPPKERRGLVLVDPPYEERDEFDRLFDGFRRAHAKWPTGIYALWYPVKDAAAVRTFLSRLRESGVPKILRTELAVRSPSNGQFTGGGLILVNPPWRFDGEVRNLLNGLAPMLAQGPGAAATVAWLTSEDGRPARA